MTNHLASKVAPGAPEAEVLEGQRALEYIRIHQSDPRLLQELASMVVRKSEEHRTRLNLPIEGATYLKPDTLQGVGEAAGKEQPGYKLWIDFWKTDDPKDPSGHHTAVFFLGTEFGRITTIYELGEVPKQIH
jgi:hypothetical protein